MASKIKEKEADTLHCTRCTCAEVAHSVVVPIHAALHGGTDRYEQHTVLAMFSGLGATKWTPAASMSGKLVCFRRTCFGWGQAME